MVASKSSPDFFRIGEVARRTSVPVATIKFYIREGLLPSAPLKTGRTMAYYDTAFVDRLTVIRRLRQEHFLPVRVIREILAEAGERPLDPDEATLLAQVAPTLVEKLRARSGDGEISTAQAQQRYRFAAADLKVLQDVGLLGCDPGTSDGHYSAGDVELLAALKAAEDAGLSRDRFPVESIGHYVELLGELVRREVRMFTRHAKDLPVTEVGSLALQAIQVTEPIVVTLRRKLLQRELSARVTEDKKGTEPK